jgi:uncharacterized protein
MRFEVGYGLEGDVTDAFSGRVLDNVVKPYFVEGRYGDGILAGIAALQEKVPMGLQEGEAPPARKRGRSQGMPTSVLIFLIIVMVLFSFVSRLLGFGGRRSRGGFLLGGGGFGGGGFGGGGSWGGGGGGFGGGGASSSW